MLIELHYLPTIDYFLELMKAEEISLECQETFQKQTYRNRTLILGANKVETLTIPVIHSADQHQLITATAIDYSTRWAHIHLQTLKSAYGRSPYFEYYFPLIEKIYKSKPPLLFDLNEQLLSACLEIMGLNIAFLKTEHYQAQLININDDKRNLIHPKKEPLNVDIIASIAYTQTFGNIFVKNLSIIDLIFNEGKNSKQILQKFIKI